MSTLEGVITMKYNSEGDLINTFKEVYFKKNNNKRSDFIVFEEMNTNWGKPDLVIIYYDKANLLKRVGILSKYSSIPIFTNLAAYAMFYLASLTKTTLNNLKDFLKVHTGQFNNVLDVLTKRGLVYIYNNTIRIRAKRKVFFIKRIEVYEAKIENWKRAIYQAQRHLWFTSESYIITPAEMSSDISKKITFYCKKAGIGLVLQESKDSFKTVSKPIGRGLLDSYISWKFNELLVDEVLNEK